MPIVWNGYELVENDISEVNFNDSANSWWKSGESVSKKEKIFKKLNSLRQAIDFELEDDTFIEAINILESAYHDIGPDEQAYIFGKSRRGVYVLIDDLTVYIIPRSKKFENSAKQIAYDIKTKMREIFGCYRTCSTNDGLMLA